MNSLLIIKVINYKKSIYFNPRSPHGERRLLLPLCNPQIIFQSTLPARGATPCCQGAGRNFFISIHAPRTGSDRYRSGRFRLLLISIHAPRTGSDLATVYAGTGQGHFNPRSPHGERLPDGFLRPRVCHFNPRSPHGERLCSDTRSHLQDTFQSTLPARGATPLPILRRRRCYHFNPRSPHGERHSCILL